MSKKRKKNADSYVFLPDISRFWIVGVFCVSTILGCEDGKYSQCEQIFHIARNANSRIQNISEQSQGIVDSSGYLQQSREMKSWLAAANMMNQAADNIVALKLYNSKLAAQRQKLATIYRLYAQATYDAVEARENKNINALKIARTDAERAGKMQQDLIREINAYCVGEMN